MDEKVVMGMTDTDLYKLKVQQGAFLLHPDLEVEMSLVVRPGDGKTSRSLSMAGVEFLQREIAALGSLRYEDQEIDDLRKYPFFKESFLSMLRTFRYDTSLIDVDVIPEVALSGPKQDRRYRVGITARGPLFSVSPLEIPCLQIYNAAAALDYEESNSITCHESEQRAFDIVKKDFQECANEMRTLWRKRMEAQQRGPYTSGLILSEFGTRRRRSFDLQKKVFSFLSEESFRQPDVLSCVPSTSNVLLSRSTGPFAVGTVPHEWFMLYLGLERVRNAQRRAIEDWMDLYRDDSLVFLTDTFGTDFFLSQLDRRTAERMDGFRHDSGDPLEWFQKVICRLTHLGVSSSEKKFVFSNGLNLATAAEIMGQIAKRGSFLTAFGIGRSLTNPYVPDSGAVMKLTESDGYPVFKLSDDSRKTTGKSRQAIDLFLSDVC